MLTAITWLIVLLTSLSVLLSLFAIVSRIISERSEARIHLIRSGMLHSIDRFIARDSNLEEVCTELAKDRQIALGALIHAGGRLLVGERTRLHVLFQHFHFADDEIFVLDDPNWTTRARAATRLGFMGAHYPVPWMRLLNDKMLDVRLAAAHSLAHMGQSQMTIPIIESLALPGDWPLQRATEIMCEMGDGAIDPLFGYLLQQDKPASLPVLQVAIRTLGMLRATKAAPVVADFLKRPEAELRVSSARALGQIADARAVQPLCELLDDKIWEVRNAAVQALGNLKDRSAIPALARALADSAWWVRFNAAQALYQLNSEGREALNSAMSTSQDRYAQDISRQILEEHGAIVVEERLNP